MILVFLGLIKDIPTALITCGTRPPALCGRIPAVGISSTNPTLTRVILLNETFVCMVALRYERHSSSQFFTVTASAFRPFLSQVQGIRLDYLFQPVFPRRSLMGNSFIQSTAHGLKVPPHKGENHGGKMDPHTHSAQAQRQ